MQRRNFVTAMAGAAAVMALPVASFATQLSVNAFTANDTLAQRIEKLNALMGTRFALRLDAMPKGVRDDPKWRAELERTYMNYPATHIFDGDRGDGGGGDVGWRISLWQDGKQFTGSMRLTQMFHWTAQVALGYRLAKGQTA